MGSDELVTYLSTDTHYTLYSQSTPVYLDMEILTFNCMLLLIRAGFSPADD